MRFPTIDDALLARLDQPVPRYTSYPTPPVWREDFGAEGHAAALAAAAARPGEPLSLYVHIPFCRRLCSYCGCNVVVTRDPQRVARYVEDLGRELALVAGHLGARRRISRLHLGGGTPTTLSEAQLETLLADLGEHFEFTADAELAIEVDPAVTSRAQIETLAALGFRRLSMGVQDLDPDVQRAVGRQQSFAETAAAVEHARAAGFTSINFDLIHGLPRQTPATWAATLDAVLALAPDRLAIYSFAYLPELRPNQRRLAIYERPEGKSKLALLAQAHDALIAAGWEAVGIDHFARPDDELAVARREGRLWRDFQGYTVRRAETVAVGCSGISTLDGAIVQAHKTPGRWAEAVRAGRLPTERGLLLDAADRERRDLITQLMCNDRVDLGPGAAERFAAELARLGAYAADGLCELRGEGGREIVLTPLGRVLARLPASVFDRYYAGPGAGGARFSRAV